MILLRGFARFGQLLVAFSRRQKNLSRQLEIGIIFNLTAWEVGSAGSRNRTATVARSLAS